MEKSKFVGSGEYWELVEDDKADKKPEEEPKEEPKEQ